MTRLAYLMLLFLTGCSTCFLNLTQLKVDCDYLASMHVGTPDPRQLCPPCGEQILIEWKTPKSVLACDPFIELHVVYRNYTEDTFIYPLSHMVGYTCYSLLGQDYEEKKGILTFRADLKLADGTVYKSWKHQLWVKLITVEESAREAEETSDSVVDQSMQGSVIETPNSSSPSVD